MTDAQLLIAVNTVWVVFAAVLVMFMQAGFAFLEAGLTRMKNAARIAGKNVIILTVCTLIYWAVSSFGIAFGEGNALVGAEPLPAVGGLAARGRRGAVLVLHDGPGRAAPFQFVSPQGFAWRCMEHVALGQALGILRVRRVLHARLLDRLALDLGWRLAVRHRHADFAGSTVVHSWALSRRSPARC